MIVAGFETRVSTKPVPRRATDCPLIETPEAVGGATTEIEARPEGSATGVPRIEIGQARSRQKAPLKRHSGGPVPARLDPTISTSPGAAPVVTQRVESPAKAGSIEGKHGARHFRTHVAKVETPEDFARVVDEYFPRDPE